MNKKSVFPAITVLIFSFCVLLQAVGFTAPQTVDAAAVKINKTKAELYVTDTLSLKVSNTKSKVTWSTNKKAIAAVSQSGKVTAKNPGKALITAKVNGKKYNCTITVRNYTLNKTVISLEEKANTQLTLNGCKKLVQWTSDNEDAAIVTSNGMVYGKQEGAAKITASSGGRNYDCIIIVKRSPSQNVTDNQTSGNTAALSAEDIYNKSKSATVEIITYDKNKKALGLGSGFFISNDRLITNYHVIEGAYSAKVTTYDNKTYDINYIMGYSKEKDIAVLSVSFPHDILNINEKKAVVGQKVYTLGSSKGLTGTFSEGIISSASRLMNNIECIQITAPISSGNSGGPLLNTSGEVIGINSMQYSNGQNLNFAITIHTINEIDTSKQISFQTLAGSAADTIQVPFEASLFSTDNETPVFLLVMKNTGSKPIIIDSVAILDSDMQYSVSLINENINPIESQTLKPSKEEQYCYFSSSDFGEYVYIDADSKFAFIYTYDNVTYIAAIDYHGTLLSCSEY